MIQPINLKKHLKVILQIEQDCHIDPWDADVFNKCLNFNNTEGVVIYFENEVCGYLIFEKNAKVLRIINLTIAPHRQRFGLGTQLIKALKQWIGPEGAIEMKLSDKCLDAHLFLAKQGFKAEQTIRNFFRVEDHYEDAYCFVYRPKVKLLKLKEMQNSNLI